MSNKHNRHIQAVKTHNKAHQHIEAERAAAHINAIYKAKRRAEDEKLFKFERNHIAQRIYNIE